MRIRLIAQVMGVLVLTVGIVCTTAGCTISHHQTQDESSYSGASDGRDCPSGTDEEQSTWGSGAQSSGALSGSPNEEPPRDSQFRDTAEGEPLAIHRFINRVIIDDEYTRITLHAKTADELGDAGFTLKVVNKYQSRTSVGRDNYCYITPVMGTWTVNGVAMDPKAEGQVFPGKSGTIYLYFDELSSIEELVEVKGEFELYYITDWWNPVGVYEFYQS